MEENRCEFSISTNASFQNRPRTNNKMKKTGFVHFEVKRLTNAHWCFSYRGAKIKRGMFDSHTNPLQTFFLIFGL